MKLTPAILLNAYSQGVFPMAEDQNAEELLWFSPEERGVIPLDAFHLPRSLQKYMRTMPYEIHLNKDFSAVIKNCADKRTASRKETWINQTIIDVYTQLHHLGHAHSVEAWREGKLMGGLYGVSLGGAFFGESMFSDATNASKVCLVALVQHLKRRGFTLLDCQWVNDHLTQFGCIPIKKREYLRQLEAALALDVSF